MHTSMLRESSTFTTTVRVPPGTELDIVYLITKTEEGEVVDLRRENDQKGRALGRAVAFGGQIDVQSTP